MANEIRTQQKIAVNNGNTKVAFPASGASKSWDQTAEGGPTPGFVTIGTSEESESFSELSTLGWFMMQNLDATNYVEWGFSTGVYGGRMEAGEPAGPFRLNLELRFISRRTQQRAKCKSTRLKTNGNRPGNRTLHVRRREDDP